MDLRGLGFDTTAPLGPAGDGSPRVRYRRRRHDKLVAGVAGGLADHLRLNPLHVRIAFAVLAGVSGFGVVLYGVFWVLVPQAEPAGATQPPGLSAASRRGFRYLPGRDARPESAGQLVALLAVGVGALWFLEQTGFGVDRVVLWPAIVVAAGLAVVWWQADQAELRAAADEDIPRSRRLLGIARWVVGAALVVIGLATFLVLAGGARAAARGLLGGAVLVAGAALIVGPYLLRLWRTLADERAERLRSQTHADLAAHLHDSVLQTLALIQRQAHDPREVVRLARGQERDLRTFLYRDGASPGTAAEVTTLAAALRRAAAEVEDAHGLAVEVVTVGDVPLDGPAGESRRALLAAAREAMVNAAVHAGTAIDVYAEVDGEAVTAYIRDRGAGFDPAAVPEDRAGVRHSILGRMERHGGRATVRSRPDSGTEIELRTGE